MRNILLFFSILMLFSNCASIFNSKVQPVSFQADYDYDEILVDGKAPQIKEGKVVLNRDMKPKQVTVKKDGYKDQNLTLVQTKLTPMLWVSMITFVPMQIDGRSDKALAYEKEVLLGEPLKLNDWEEGSKKLKLNKVSTNMEAENLKLRSFRSQRQHNKKGEKQEAKVLDKEGNLKLDNTIFSDLLNDLLVSKGYIDTTNRIFTSSYANNMLINATIKDMTINNVYTNEQAKFYGGMMYMELAVDWELLDYYNTPIYKTSTITKSDKFAIQDYSKEDLLSKKAVKDALEVGLIELIGSKEVIALLHEDSGIQENSYTELILPKANKYVSSLSESVNSSLTIKTKNGHGSGFLISPDGHILTNYHVVSNPENLKVIMSDQRTFDVEIVRTSKNHDLALLKIDVKGMLPFQLSDNGNLEVAQEIYAVGTPTAEDLSQTVSKGIVSAIRQLEGGAKIIQTDASINRGNSGGAIVTQEGLVRGVVSSKLTGFGIEGVAFGIPAEEITNALKLSFN